MAVPVCDQSLKFFTAQFVIFPVFSGTNSFAKSLYFVSFAHTKVSLKLFILDSMFFFSDLLKLSDVLFGCICQEEIIESYAHYTAKIKLLK